MSKLPLPLQQLIAILKLLPGVGTKTAERFAFQLLNWSSADLTLLSTLVATIKDCVPQCTTCGCLSTNQGCDFCHSPHRDRSLLCIVGSVKDVYSIEETSTYKGRYYVLGSLLSPLDGRTIEQLNLAPLMALLSTQEVTEVIIALDSTLEGDATSLYLKEKIKPLEITISRPAFGLPVGSPLDYIDEGTLSRALTMRTKA